MPAWSGEEARNQNSNYSIVEPDFALFLQSRCASPGVFGTAHEPSAVCINHSAAEPSNGRPSILSVARDYSMRMGLAFALPCDWKVLCVGRNVKDTRVNVHLLLFNWYKLNQV